MRIKVKYIKFHGGDAYVPGIGQLGPHLPHASKSWKVDMWVDTEIHPNLLFLNINELKGAVPLSSIQNMLLGDLE